MESRDRQYRQYIGVLASNDEADGKKNIFINRERYIQFRVKSLLLPQTDTTFVTGFNSSFENDVEIYDDEYLDDQVRVEQFEEILEDKLFIYNYKINDAGFATLSSKKTNLVRQPENFNKDTLFHAIPVFKSKNNVLVNEWEEEQNAWREAQDRNLWKLMRNYDTREEFIECIREKKSVGGIFGYFADPFTPSFVIWMEEEGSVYAIGYLNAISETGKGGLILDFDRIVEVDISEFSSTWVYQESLNPTLMFLPEDIYAKIEGLIAKTQSIEPSIKQDENKEEAKEVEIEEVEASIQEEEEIETEGMIDIDTSKKTDELIIEAMNYHSIKRDLFYNKKDFVNFHTAIKCSSLVILSGLSGTGKSAIVDLYARALGVGNSPDESRLLFIPVRPSWNDDSDLLGYIDLVHMVYRASDSGFVDFLVKAQKEENKNKLFIVCFDEMNLARVEHYFSQFLSLLERPANQRQLQLYDEQYSGRLYNSSNYPSKINIGDNIKFIGTVNVDESTYHFSDKVLDRANVIRLDVLNYSKMWKKKSVFMKEVKWSFDEYKALVASYSDENMENVHKLLWDLHTLLHHASEKYGIGPRIVKSIDTYLLNLPKTKLDYFTYEDGIDLQIAQRVLTKVRGSETELGDILNENGENNMLKIFEKYKELSHFENCRNVVRQKQKELKSYGYCI